MSANLGFGIDFGGSGIKGGLIDIDKGQLIGDRIRLETPQPSTPDVVAKTVTQLVDHFDWKGRVGIAVPSVVKKGTTHTAANIDPSWIGTNAQALFSQHLGRVHHDIVVLNDGDAAGIAEIEFGDTAARQGVTVLLTFGTGIGSAVFLDGKLLPNTELGHLEVDGYVGEARAAASIRESEGLSFSQWAKRVRRYLNELEKLFWPDHFIVGGGISRKSDRWVPLLDIKTKVIVASLHNNAGIVGAGMAAAQGIEP